MTYKIGGHQGRHESCNSIVEETGYCKKSCNVSAIVLHVSSQANRVHLFPQAL